MFFATTLAASFFYFKKDLLPSHKREQKKLFLECIQTLTITENN